MVCGNPWQNGSHAEIIELLGHGPIWPVRYTLDGQECAGMASGSGDGKVVFWPSRHAKPGAVLTSIQRPKEA